MIGLMDAAIARIERLAGNGDCQRIAGGQTLRVSDSDQRVVSLKTRLGQTGLLRGSPGYFGSPSFDGRLETAIRGFQDQMGLRATSRLDRATLTQLNVPPEVTSPSSGSIVAASKTCYAIQSRIGMSS